MADEQTRAYDMLLAAAQAVVNDGLEVAEERAHPCDVHNDEAKAKLMPPPLQALYHATNAARRAAPIAAQLDQPEQPKSAFQNHLAESGKAVEGWPAWKTGLWNSDQDAQLDAELPPLPPAIAHASKGITAFFVKWSEDAHVLRGNIVLYTAEQVEKIRRADVAPYAERIRLLTEELAKDRAAWLAEMKADAEMDRQGGAKSIDTPEFESLLGDFAAETIGAERFLDWKPADEAKRKIIAYIDGHTAGAAPECIGYAEAVALRNFEKGLSDELYMVRHSQAVDEPVPVYAAAPSPQENTKCPE